MDSAADTTGRDPAAAENTRTTEPQAAEIFDAPWTKDHVAALHPAGLPVTKARRGWDRVPQEPVAPDARYRKVWRRYETRSLSQKEAQADGEGETKGEQEQSGVQDAKSPGRIVKRLRVRSSTGQGAQGNAGSGAREDGDAVAKPTKWDRRKSGLPRKKPFRFDFQVDPKPHSLSLDPGLHDTTHEEHDSQSVVEQDQSEGAQKLGEHEAAVDDVEGHSEERSAEFEVDLLIPIDTVEYPVLPLDASGHYNVVVGGQETSNSDARLEDPSQQPSMKASLDEATTSIQDDLTDAQDNQLHDDALRQASEPVMQDQDPARGQTPDDHATEAPVRQTHESHENQISAAPTEDTASVTITEEIVPNMPPNTQDTQSNSPGIASQAESPSPVPADPPEHDAEDHQLGTTVIVGSAEKPASEGRSSTDSQAISEGILSKISIRAESSAASQQVIQDDITATSNSDENCVVEEIIYPTTTPVNNELNSTETVRETPENMSEDTMFFRVNLDTEQLSAQVSLEQSEQHLDHDTEILKDFLSRAAASKANKAATITRRTSLQNRRDSDAIRQALASPSKSLVAREALGAKDPNSPNKTGESSAFDQLDDTVTLIFPQNSTNALQATSTKPESDAATDQSMPVGHHYPSRRSKRQGAGTRIPLTPGASHAPPQNRIPVRRADGQGAPVVLQKTEAQELANLTKSNTRKNKGRAVYAAIRLKYLKVEQETSLSAPEPDVAAVAQDIKERAKTVRWNERPVFFAGDIGAVLKVDDDAAVLAEAPVAGSVSWTQQAQKAKMTDEAAAPSVLTDEDKMDTAPDRDSVPGPASSSVTFEEPAPTTPKVRTSRAKRLRGLGASNGTPAKGLLSAASLLPDDIEDTESTAKKSSSSSTTTSDGLTTTAQPSSIKVPTVKASAKSRLATPKKLALTVTESDVIDSVASVGAGATKPAAARTNLPVPAAAEKENRIAAMPAKKIGGALPVPSVGGGVARRGRARRT